jgi:hypothetical protein
MTGKLVEISDHVRLVEVAAIDSELRHIDGRVGLGIGQRSPESQDAGEFLWRQARSVKAHAPKLPVADANLAGQMRQRKLAGLSDPSSDCAPPAGALGWIAENALPSSDVLGRRRGRRKGAEQSVGSFAPEFVKRHNLIGEDACWTWQPRPRCARMESNTHEPIAS